MALIICKECHKEFSDTAFRCPHCGATWSAARGKEEGIGCFSAMILGYLGIVLIIVGIIGLFAAYYFGHTSELGFSVICFIGGIMLVMRIFRKPRDRQ
jgi:hypothetical protein